MLSHLVFLQLFFKQYFNLVILFHKSSVVIISCVKTLNCSFILCPGICVLTAQVLDKLVLLFVFWSLWPNYNSSSPSLPLHTHTHTRPSDGSFLTRSLFCAIFCLLTFACFILPKRLQLDEWMLKVTSSSHQLSVWGRQSPSVHTICAWYLPRGQSASLLQKYLVFWAHLFGLLNH